MYINYAHHLSPIDKMNLDALWLFSLNLKSIFVLSVKRETACTNCFAFTHRQLQRQTQAKIIYFFQPQTMFCSRITNCAACDFCRSAYVCATAICAVCSVRLLAQVFFFFGTRSGIRIGSGLTRTDHNSIEFVNFNLIGFQSRPDPTRPRNLSGQVGSDR